MEGASGVRTTDLMDFDVYFIWAKVAQITFHLLYFFPEHVLIDKIQLCLSQSCVFIIIYRFTIAYNVIRFSNPYWHWRTLTMRGILFGKSFILIFFMRIIMLFVWHTVAVRYFKRMPHPKHEIKMLVQQFWQFRNRYPWYLLSTTAAAVTLDCTENMSVLAPSR